MTHYCDLAPCDYFGEPGVPLRAVGWLDPSREFDRGTVDADRVSALARLAIDPWQPWAIAGRHPCPFCEHTGGPAEIVIGGLRVRVGANNVFVPTASCIYVMPTLGLHYIDSHRYSPPSEFLDAALACPTMRSMAYLAAIAGLKLKRS